MSKKEQEVNTVSISKEDAIAGYKARVAELVAEVKDFAEEAQRDWCSASYRKDTHQNLEHAQTALTEAVHCLEVLEEMGELEFHRWEYKR